MSDYSTHFEAVDGRLVLANAILLYRSDTRGLSRSSGDDSFAFASMHPVTLDSEDRPTIEAGTPLTRAHLRQWTEALGRTAIPHILPENVLVSNPDLLVWWVAEQVRPAYFALSSPPDDLRELGERTIVPVPYPAHLFIATRSGLGIFALPANQRPTADTRLLHSPILNVFVEGHLCWGNIARPKQLSPAAIPEFERAVFDSWSTHPNPGQEFTVKGKGGLIALWDDLAARRARRFPVSRLKPFIASTRQGTGQKQPANPGDPFTLERLIAAIARK